MIRISFEIDLLLFQIGSLEQKQYKKKEQVLDVNRAMRSETENSVPLSHHIARPAAKASRDSTDESQYSGLFCLEESWEKWHRDASRVFTFCF